MEKEDVTHQIELTIRFDSPVMDEKEIRRIISDKERNFEGIRIAGCEFGDSSVKVIVDVFSSFIPGSLEPEIIKDLVLLHWGGLDMPDNIKRSNLISVKVKKVEPVSIR